MIIDEQNVAVGISGLYASTPSRIPLTALQECGDAQGNAAHAEMQKSGERGSFNNA